MDPRFYEAWFNTEHTVLGRKLHPFCLQDALVLSLSGSPFLLGTGEAVSYSLIDLQLAVKVCSTPAEVFLNAGLGGNWFARLRNILWATRCRRLALEIECQKFVTYIDDFYSYPETWNDGDENTLRAPWVLSNAVFLLRHTTLSRAEIWSMPLGMALWYAATIAEQLGSKAQLLSDDELKGLEALGKR